MNGFSCVPDEVSFTFTPHFNCQNVLGETKAPAVSRTIMIGGINDAEIFS